MLCRVGSGDTSFPLSHDALQNGGKGVCVDASHGGVYCVSIEGGVETWERGVGTLASPQKGGEWRSVHIRVLSYGGGYGGTKCPHLQALTNACGVRLYAVAPLRAETCCGEFSSCQEHGWAVKGGTVEVATTARSLGPLGSLAATRPLGPLAATGSLGPLGSLGSLATCLVL